MTLDEYREVIALRNGYGSWAELGADKTTEEQAKCLEDAVELYKDYWVKKQSEAAFRRGYDKGIKVGKTLK